MNIQHQHLRMYRKRSPLLQSDIAHILAMKEYSSISRWEKGERNPSTDMLLVYHMLFEMPVDTLFGGQKWGLVEPVAERIRLRIEQLKPAANERKVARRIAFLDAALTRIKQQPEHE